MTIDRRQFVVAATALTASMAADLSTAAKNSDEQDAPEKIGLKYAFSAAVFFNERIMIDSPRGRGFVPAQGGEVWGPRLQGRVVPYGGADYASNGFHAHYQLQARDGAFIYIQNRGYVKRLDNLQLTQPRPERKAGEPIDQIVRSVGGNDVPQRFRITPIFDAPVGPHEWLTRTLFVGHGKRYVNPDHTIFTYYEVL